MPIVQSLPEPRLTLTPVVAGVKESGFSRLAFRMSGQSPEQRPPAQPYAALRTMSDAAANGAATTTASDPQYWRSEADKLDALLQTMWSGFLGADTNGLPTALADYVAAYTSAMRLKLTLMSYTVVPGRGVKAATAMNGKGRVP